MENLNTENKKNNNQKIGILGYGEVGKAVAKFYKKPKIKDLNRNDGLKGIDILNVCIPWNSNFLNIIKREALEDGVKLVIIHSTIKPGTTKKLDQLLSKKLINVVHSPIRGVHPFLHKGIKTFIKYIGAENKRSGDLAQKHLESLGIKTKIFIPSINTELGKILDTSYYGVCIAWHGEMKKICDKYGANFEKAVVDFNKSYNTGYKILGKSNVVRPVLYPPDNFIGGHCVISNAKILEEDFESSAIKLILEYKPKNK